MFYRWPLLLWPPPPPPTRRAAVTQRLPRGHWTRWLPANPPQLCPGPRSRAGTTKATSASWTTSQTHACIRDPVRGSAWGPPVARLNTAGPAALRGPLRTGPPEGASSRRWSPRAWRSPRHSRCSGKGTDSGEDQQRLPRAAWGGAPSDGCRREHPRGPLQPRGGLHAGALGWGALTAGPQVGFPGTQGEDPPWGCPGWISGEEARRDREGGHPAPEAAAERQPGVQNGHSFQLCSLIWK